jgi:hypothetical protein
MPKKVPLDSNSKVTIKIPRSLYNRLQEIVGDSGFDSVTDFTVYVLRDLASRPDHQDGPRKNHVKDSLTREEINSVRRRLKNLGYL